MLFAGRKRENVGDYGLKPGQHKRDAGGTEIYGCGKEV